MGRTSVLLAGICLLLVVSGEAAAGEPRIHYAEPVSIGPVGTSGAPEAQAKPGSLNLSFQAFAQTFELQLEPNDRLVARLPAHLADSLSRHRLYRGRLLSHPGSWARISNVAGDWRGVVFDGRELYAIVPASQVRELLVDPTPVTDAGTVIYRLSDLETGFGPDSCGVVDADGSYDSLKYDALVDDLRETLAQVVPIEGEIEIATIADFEFSQAFGAGAVDEVLLRVNIVDGIYAEQVGIAIAVPELRVFTDPDDPFTSSDMSTLLNQFANYRETTPAVRDRGLAQLFSGRTTAGTTVGIAFINSLCQPREGVSVTLAARDPMSAALIAAHEIGHNFGAPHDAESGSACQATGPFFIMAPQLNGSSEFSQCSLTRMRPAIDSATCITAGNVADAGVSGQAAITGTVIGETFEHEVTVTSRGTVAIEDVTVLLTAQWDSGVSLDSIDAEGGGCGPAGPNVQCSLGTMAVGATRRITVRARPLRIGLQTIHSRVVAPADRVSSNDTINAAFTAIPQADVALSLSTANIIAFTREPVSVTATVRSLGPRDALGVTFGLGVGTLEVDSASADGGACSVDSGLLRCTLGTIATGQSRTISMQVRGTRAGEFSTFIDVNATNGVQSLNDQGLLRFSFTSAADAQASREVTPKIVGVGQSVDFTMRVTSLGPLPVADVQAILISGPNMVIEAASVAGAACVGPPNAPTCMLGTLADGATRDIQVRVRMTSTGFTAAGLRLVASNDDNTANDLGEAHFDARHAVDVALDTINPGLMFEGRPLTLTIPVRSLGFSAANDVSVTATLPADLTVEDATLTDGQCTVMSRMFSCVRATMAPGATADLRLRLRSDVPGGFITTLTATAPNDAVAQNGVGNLSLEVRPFFDGRVEVPGVVSALLQETFDYPILVSTGARPLTSAQLNIDFLTLPLESLQAEQGVCFTTLQTRCNWVSLPANTTVRVTLRLRASSVGSFTSGIARLFVDNDGDHTNDSGQISIRVELPGDVFVSPPTASVTGRANQDLTHQIVIAAPQGTRELNDVAASISLPASFGILGVTAPFGACSSSGVAALCNFDRLSAGTQRTITLTLRPSLGGTFSGTVTVAAVNDSFADNNVQQITFNIIAASPPPANDGDSGGGGGGSCNWLFLAVLGAFLTLARKKGGNIL